MLYVGCGIYALTLYLAMTICALNLIFDDGATCAVFDTSIATGHTIVSHVVHSSLLAEEEFYVTLQDGKPVRNDVPLSFYNLHPYSSLLVISKGRGGQRQAIVDNNSLQEFLDALPSVEEVRTRINNRYDKYVIRQPDGSVKPPVCVVCDEFIISLHERNRLNPKSLQDIRPLFQFSSYPEPFRTVRLENAFTFPRGNEAVGSVYDFSGMALSPRATLDQTTGAGTRRARSTKMFTCCNTCYYSVQQAKKLPYFAVANRNWVGNPPAELLELTDLELCYLTPVKSHGYCFSYYGGTQVCLRGTLSFFRVTERATVRATSQLAAMGLHDSVIVLANGNMTYAQHEKCKNKATIRVNYILRAIEWLCHNHKKWAGINVDHYRQELENMIPIFIDNSNFSPSVNANVEEEELFSCYYPDMGNEHQDGGFETSEEFRTFVTNMKEGGADVQFKCRLERTFVSENSDILLDSCLLQFPYGICGMDERRVQMDGSISDEIPKLDEYLAHLVTLSDPVFQRPLFQLIAFNMFCKQQILASARYQLKGEVTASTLANTLTYADVQHCVRQRRHGNRNGGTQAAKTLLDACDATSRQVPHSNDASKKARGTAESMQHHFGIGSIWLTVSFDDKNSELLLVFLSDPAVDDVTPTSQLTDEECRNRCRHRNEMRIKFPGLAAINFEVLLEILSEEVIGWSWKAGRATDEPGFFGVPLAVCLSIEEQARKTLHGHFTIWIQKYRGMQKKLFFGTKKEKRLAETAMSRYQDHVSDTKMFDANNKTLLKAWEHPCKVPQRSRALPQVVTDQELRYLRHKKGFKATGGKFASCLHCGKHWTYEQLLSAYLLNVKGIKEPGAVIENMDEQDVPTNRLFCEMIDIQKGIIPMDAAKVNAAYNHHSSCHVKGCFKGSAKRGHKCDKDCECRFRMPARKKQRSTLRNVVEDMNWFTWNGELKKQPVFEMLPARQTYDLFQNVACPAITNSKFTCNSNVKLITDGPLSQYQFKYQNKNTQGEDSGEYREVLKSIKALNGERRHELDRPEAVRRIYRAAFAHQGANIAAPATCGFLVRNKSRFKFSHQFEYCPLKDINRLIERKPVSAGLAFGYENKYLENQGLHYLCRPTALEDLNVKEFYEEYMVFNCNRRRTDEEDGILYFTDTPHFKHPARAKRDGSKWQQAVMARLQRAYIKVPQWMFDDTANFKHNILTCDPSAFNSRMDQYARLVTSLFLPFRCLDDLKRGTGQYPFLTKLRYEYSQDTARQQPIYFTEENLQFLQNIQDAAHNSLRYKLITDDLEAVTKPFKEREHGDIDLSDDEDEDDVMEMQNQSMEYLLDLLEDDEPTAGTMEDTDPANLTGKLQNMSFRKIRDKGLDGCGQSLDFDVPRRINPDFDCVASETEREEPNNDGTPEAPCDERILYPCHEIVRVLFRRTQARRRAGVFKTNDAAEVSDANGSVASITEWASAAGLDKYQTRSFQSLVAAFLLTFYEKPASGDDSDNRTKLRHARSKLQLKKLRGTGEKHLMMLLHGPGGSGKSTVIELVIEYARDFCRVLNHPFTSRTIIVSAMTGVAATLIKGQTTHMVLRLNAKYIKVEDQLDFCETRLVIIDEISFANQDTMEKAHSNMCLLMQSKFDDWGGQNMCFAGDFSQMEPPTGYTLYRDGAEVPEFHGMINAYVELDGMHRFKDDMEWGERNMRFRAGAPTLEDIRYINQHCVADLREDTPPERCQVACHTNKSRDAVNSCVFEEYCKLHKPADGGILTSACLVFMDDLYLKENQGFHAIQSNALKRAFWERHGEDDIWIGTTRNRTDRVDPCLKLYEECPLMFTENKDVLNGQANGTRTRFKKLFLKDGEATFPVRLACGTIVRGVFASQIRALLVEHEIPDMLPRTFEVEPKSYTFNTKMKVGTESLNVTMQGTQIPLLSNTATTGHKLQGCTVTALYVNDWHYGSNWAYVVLSRVRTMRGLWMRRALSEDLEKYEMKEYMLAMMKKFADTVLLDEISDDELVEMIRMEDVPLDNGDDVEFDIRELED